MSDHQTTHFGFKKIPLFEKAGRVERLFTDVSPHYDRMNDAMSFGLHRLWKDRFVSRIKLTKDAQILDLASGTGDIVLRLLKKAKQSNTELQITALDLTAEMMRPARARLIDQGLFTPITYIQGNAEELPFADNSQDIVTISFGLRNVPQIDKALSEAYRVLKPGGTFYCLEFSKIFIKPFRSLYQAYAFRIIPKMGKRIAQNEDAYQYLVESIEQFPDQETLAEMLREAGFCSVNFRNMTTGVVAMHWGHKLYHFKK